MFGENKTSKMNLKSVSQSSQLVLNLDKHNYVVYPMDDDGRGFSQVAYKYLHESTRSHPNRNQLLIRDPHGIDSGNFDNNKIISQKTLWEKNPRWGSNPYSDIGQSFLDSSYDFGTFFEHKGQSGQLVYRAGQREFKNHPNTMEQFFDQTYYGAPFAPFASTGNGNGNGNGSLASRPRHIFLVMAEPKFAVEVQKRLERVAGNMDCSHIMILHMSVLTNDQIVREGSDTFRSDTAVRYNILESAIIMTPINRTPFGLFTQRGPPNTGFRAFRMAHEGGVDKVTFHYVPGTLRPMTIYVRGSRARRQYVCDYLKYVAAAAITEGAVSIVSDDTDPVTRRNAICVPKWCFRVIIGSDVSGLANTFANTSWQSNNLALMEVNDTLLFTEGDIVFKEQQKPIFTSVFCTHVQGRASDAKDQKQYLPQSTYNVQISTQGNPEMKLQASQQRPLRRQVQIIQRAPNLLPNNTTPTDSDKKRTSAAMETDVVTKKSKLVNSMFL